MQTQEIKKLLETSLNCEAHVESEDGHHYNAVVIAAEFIGKTRVQQQRLVYGILGTAITDGSIHALSLKTFTPEEWQAQHG